MGGIHQSSEKNPHKISDLHAFMLVVVLCSIFFLFKRKYIVHPSSNSPSSPTKSPNIHFIDCLLAVAFFLVKSSQSTKVKSFDAADDNNI